VQTFFHHRANDRKRESTPDLVAGFKDYACLEQRVKKQGPRIERGRWDPPRQHAQLWGVEPLFQRIDRHGGKFLFA
jgi:hypothetical protein